MTEVLVANELKPRDWNAIEAWLTTDKGQTLASRIQSDTQLYDNGIPKILVD